MSHPDHDRVGKKSVLTHPWREGNRVVRHDSHNQRPDRCGKTGRDENSTKIHPGVAENTRIDYCDVGHCQECGTAGHYFLLDAGLAFAQFKGAF
mgnify:CR=1 FL=1